MNTPVKCIDYKTDSGFVARFAVTPRGKWMGDVVNPNGYSIGRRAVVVDDPTLTEASKLLADYTKGEP